MLKRGERETRGQVTCRNLQYLLSVSTNKDFWSASLLRSGRATNPYQLAVLTLSASRVPRRDHAQCEGNARIRRVWSRTPAGILITEEQSRDSGGFIPRRRVSLHKLRVPHLIRKFRTFYGTRSFITAFTANLHIGIKSLPLAMSLQQQPTQHGLSSWWIKLVNATEHLNIFHWFLVYQDTQLSALNL